MGYAYNCPQESRKYIKQRAIIAINRWHFESSALHAAKVLKCNGDTYTFALMQF